MGCSREVRPPVTKHAPSMWGYTFSNSVIDEQEQKKYAEAIEALKQEARGMLMAAATPLKQMIFIDTLERLGLAYHFEIEIDHKLQQINDIFFAQRHHDLFTTALAFRLLRQHCHHISSDVFDKFVNKDGKFEVGRGDPEGLLSLYEAAHVRFPGEKILQEAAIFTRHQLIEMGAELESPLKEKVKRALERPLHRDIPIVYARIFISIYEKDPSRNELLLKLAKFNFNFLQNLYRDELSQLSRWWSKLDLKSKLPYTRDRVVEAYIWGVGFHYEPHYSFARMGLVKAFKITGIVDDTYDNYATLNEAQLFTEILDKWDAKEVDRLPDYMKIVYHFVLTIVEDYERNAVKLGKGFAAPYFKEMVQQLARAYNKELNWVMEKQLPSFEEYLKNSEITSCIYILFSSIIMGLKSTTQETIDWIKSEPKLAISTGMLGRYWDDIGSHQRESKGGEMLTALDCYMKQHGTSKQETLSKFAERVEEAWEYVNHEWITATSFMPKETAVLFLNYARNCDATYNKSNGDGYTDPKLSAEIVAALFLHPILNI